MDNIRNELFERMKSAGRANEMTLKFKMMNTNEAKVLMALSIMDTFDSIPSVEREVKNAKASIDLKNEANRIFISGKGNVEDLIKAWEIYSKSIALAPTSSQELSIAYANRSALLIELHKYTKCIEDINRALELGYPNHLKGKLLVRKVACMNKLTSDSNNIKNVIDEATSWLESMSLDNDEKEKFKEKLKPPKSIQNSKISSKSTTIKDFPAIVRNKKIPCASDAIAINYNEKFGRHIVTTRKVNPGEILVIEKAYANLLSAEEVYIHCSHCLKVYWSMFPCESCTHAMYCSIECKNEAWEQYHDIECAVTGYLLSLNFNKCSLFSMRLAIIALREAGSMEILKKNVKAADECTDPCAKGFGEDGLYHSDRYTSLYSLVTNSEKRSVADLFERALNAALIVYYMCTVTNFFGKKFDPDLQEIMMEKDALYIGGLILHNMQIIPSNIHSVLLYFDYEEERRIDTIDIGASALPFCSLINHSCDPNVSRCSTDKSMIIFAIVPIEKGSQIYDNYGMNYAVMNKFEREEKLSQYYFKCECKACNKDWPTYDKLISYNQLLSDKDVKRRIAKALENFDSYVTYATEGRIEDKPNLLNNLSKMINTLFKYVQPPCLEVNNVVETLKRVVALTYGNKFEIPNLN